MEHDQGWKRYRVEKYKIYNEIRDRDRRKKETKEERRVRRNIRWKMAREETSIEEL